MIPFEPGRYTRVASKIRINGDLRGRPLVRVIAADDEMIGTMSLADALRAAVKAGLDLVEVNPRGDPPVCRILDFARYEDGARRT